MVLHKPLKSSPISLAITNMHSTTAPTRHRVCTISVHTSVLTPPLKV